MKRLLVLAALLTSASLSFAESSAPEVAIAGDVKAAEARVKSGLIQPLAAKEREQSKFSRARMPAQERRVRVDGAPSTDAKGQVFYTFAIDAKHGFEPAEKWRLATITGCAYAGGEIFVKKGDQFRPAAFLLGKNLKPVADVCTPATQTASKS